MPRKDIHRENAIEAAGELLALSNHLAGRMGEGALAHMEQVALRIFKESGVDGLRDEYYPAGKTSATLQKVVDASVALAEFLLIDGDPAAYDEGQYEEAFAKYTRELVNALANSASLEPWSPLQSIAKKRTRTG